MWIFYFLRFPSPGEPPSEDFRAQNGSPEDPSFPGTHPAGQHGHPTGGHPRPNSNEIYLRFTHDKEQTSAIIRFYSSNHNGAMAKPHLYANWRPATAGATPTASPERWARGEEGKRHLTGLSPCRMETCSPEMKTMLKPEGWPL